MSVEVRLARGDELTAAGEVAVAGYAADGLVPPGSAYGDRLRDTATRAREAELYVAVADGTVVGTVTYCPEKGPWSELAVPGEGEFRMLAVPPSARGRGIGRLLVERCLARSHELGHRAVVLSSAREMATAHRLYERLGFHRTPYLDWSPLPGVDLLAFRLDLTATGTGTGPRRPRRG